MFLHVSVRKTELESARTNEDRKQRNSRSPESIVILLIHMDLVTWPVLFLKCPMQHCKLLISTNYLINFVSYLQTCSVDP